MNPLPTAVLSHGTMAALGKPVVPEVDISTHGERDIAPLLEVSGARYGGKYSREDASPESKMVVVRGSAPLRKSGASRIAFDSSVKTFGATSGSTILLCR